MKSVIVGATAGVGRALSVVLAKKGHSLLLVGRDTRDLNASASSLKLCYDVEVQILTADALDPSSFTQLLSDAATSFGEINYLFLPIGGAIGQDTGVLQLEEMISLLNSNLLSVISAVQIFSRFQSIDGPAGIVGFSSIAAIRGRGENIVYAAAKRALESYFESLKYVFIDSNTSVHLYRLGYVNTQQSYGKKLALPKISPDRVARHVVGILSKTSSFTYYPRYWRLVALLLRSLPLSLFKRIAK